MIIINITNKLDFFLFESLARDFFEKSFIQNQKSREFFFTTFQSLARDFFCTVTKL